MNKLNNIINNIVDVYNLKSEINKDFKDFNDEHLIDSDITNIDYNFQYKRIMINAIIDHYNDDFVSLLIYKENDCYHFSIDELEKSKIIKKHLEDYLRYLFRKSPNLLKSILLNDDNKYKGLSVSYMTQMYNDIKNYKHLFNLNNDFNFIKNCAINKENQKEIVFLFLKHDLNNFFENNKHILYDSFNYNQKEKILNLFKELMEINNINRILKTEKYESFIDLMQIKKYKNNTNLILKEFTNKDIITYNVYEFIEKMTKNGLDIKTFKKGFSPKISNIKNENQLLSNLILFEKSISEWNENIYIEKFKDNNINYYYDNNYIICEIDNYKDSSILGSNLWCISTNENNFNDYKENGKRQFFLYDFAKEKTDNLSLIGVTVYPNGEIYAAHDRFDEDIRVEIKKTLKFERIKEDYLFKKFKNAKDIFKFILNNELYYIITNDFLKKMKSNYDDYNILNIINNIKINNYGIFNKFKENDFFIEECINYFNKESKIKDLNFLYSVLNYEDIIDKKTINDLFYKIFNNYQNDDKKLLMNILDFDFNKIKKIEKERLNNFIIKVLNNENFNFNDKNLKNIFSYFKNNFSDNELNKINFKNNNIMFFLIENIKTHNMFFINKIFKKLNNDNFKILKNQINHKNYHLLPFFSPDLIDKLDLKITLIDYNSVCSHNDFRCPENLLIIMMNNTNESNKKIKFDKNEEFNILSESNERYKLLSKNLIREKDYIYFFKNFPVVLSENVDSIISNNIIEYISKFEDTKFKKEIKFIEKYLTELCFVGINCDNVKSLFNEKYNLLDENVKKIINKKEKQLKLKW